MSGINEAKEEGLAVVLRVAKHVRMRLKVLAAERGLSLYDVTNLVLTQHLDGEDAKKREHLQNSTPLKFAGHARG
ncbi:MAG: hypothetical protein ABIW82_16885 [Dokdonella sp.]